MTKKLDAETFAQQATAPLQPVVTGNMAADVKQTPLPARNPLPADLARALGQTDR